MEAANCPNCHRTNTGVQLRYCQFCGHSLEGVRRVPVTQTQPGASTAGSLAATGAVASSEVAERRAKRPLGVWISTIWFGFWYGLLPVVAVLVFPLLVSPADELELTISPSGEILSALVILSVLLSLSILVTAVGAWSGNNTARIAFVALVVVRFALETLDSILTVSGDDSAVIESTAVCRGLVFLVWTGILVWYFRSERVKPFYGLR